LSRSSIIFTASFALAIAACGDDTTSSTGSGGGSSSSATTTTTTGGTPTSTTTSSSSSSSSSDGGSTSDGGGGSGDGAGGAGDGGSGGNGLGGNPSFEELCEYQNDQFQGYSDELGCPLTRVGECELPAGCEDETIAFHECYYEFLSIEDCACLFDAEEGEEVLQCPVAECDDEDDALYECLFG
jgi:hypothetical protein